MNKNRVHVARTARRESRLEMIPEENEGTTTSATSAHVTSPRPRLLVVDRLLRVTRHALLALGIVCVGFGAIFIAFSSVARFSSVELRRPGVALLVLGLASLLTAVVWIARRSLNKKKTKTTQQRSTMPRHQPPTRRDVMSARTTLDQRDIRILFQTHETTTTKHVTFDPDQPSTSGLQT